MADRSLDSIHGLFNGPGTPDKLKILLQWSSSSISHQLSKYLNRVDANNTNFFHSRTCALVVVPVYRTLNHSHIPHYYCFCALLDPQPLLLDWHFLIRPHPSSGDCLNAAVWTLVGHSFVMIQPPSDIYNKPPSIQVLQENLFCCLTTSMDASTSSPSPNKQQKTTVDASQVDSSDEHLSSGTLALSSSALSHAEVIALQNELDEEDLDYETHSIQ
ncbi:hypothetical protein FB446DRAFT_791788 [Lentinula raphanica]|nr:hypothetical protein FB446DRAFT_791788 [Lentinula raphanica]